MTSAANRRRRAAGASLFPREVMVEAEGHSILARLRSGDAGRPLIVFLPGGGHLARIAYGHPGGRPDDFLDHWLGEKGFGLLALSYPNDHPLFANVHPAMTSGQWSRCAARVTRDLVRSTGLTERIVLAGWSMAGKTVPVYARHAAELGLAVEAFISLAATPPVPGLARYAPAGEHLTAEGLWDCATPLAGRSRHDGWLEELRRTDAENGRCIIPPAVYAAEYRCGTPRLLRGEALP